jgi:hypothetical protein
VRLPLRKWTAPQSAFRMCKKAVGLYERFASSWPNSRHCLFESSIAFNILFVMRLMNRLWIVHRVSEGRAMRGKKGGTIRLPFRRERKADDLRQGEGGRRVR